MMFIGVLKDRFIQKTNVYIYPLCLSAGDCFCVICPDLEILFHVELRKNRIQNILEIMILWAV